MSPLFLNTNSMGSENWINFVEIKSHYLFSYLKAMKSRGYSIVGAEQTASGKFLHNTALPHKMILVLGYITINQSVLTVLIFNSIFVHLQT